MTTDTAIRRLLASLLAVVALNAFGGGWYGVSGAQGVPRAWLEGSPFSSYLVPSLVLLIVVGGGCAIAAIAVLSNGRFGGPAAVGAGLVCLAWIAAQVAFIGFVSWLQPAVACAGVAMVVLGRRLARTPRHASRSGR